MDEQSILNTYQKLRNQQDTANELGLPLNQVVKVLRKHKVDCKASRHKKRFDPNEILRLWNEYQNTGIVAEKMGCSRSHVAKTLRVEFDMPVPAGLYQKKDLPMDEIIERYLAGETCGQIAKDYPIQSEGLRRRLKKAGVPRRSAADSVPRGEDNVFYKNGKGKEYEPMHYYRRQCYEVAAICFGQPLEQGKVIHHINENPRDNRPENLLVFPSLAAHAGYHTRLLRRLQKGHEVDAIQYALRNGAVRLPPPPHPILLPPCIDQPDPSDMQEMQEQDQQQMELVQPLLASSR